MRCINTLLLQTVLYLATASLLNQQTVEEIKQRTTLWTAHNNNSNPLRHKTSEQLAQLLGAIIPQTPQIHQDLVQSGISIPTSYDLRTAYPNCSYAIQDQQQCGSCVYFASANYLQHRFCRNSNGSVDVRLSPQYTLDCDTNMQDRGCQGSYLNTVNQFLVNHGTTSQACVNYISGNGQTSETCQNQCRNGSALALYKCQNLKQFTTPQQIQNEILANGAVQVSFNVYSDFYNYRSGIYHYVSGYLVGGHSVTLLGWGTDPSGVQYWIAENQWGQSFGMSGFFNIAFGQCGIDSNGWACVPVLDVQPVPIPPNPQPPVPTVNCWTQDQLCLQSGQSVVVCNAQFFSCLFPKN